MLQKPGSDLRAFGLAAATLILLLCVATPLRAQSGEASLPTPVFTNDVGGRIAPRDVGDPRRTRHFYTFRGTEGDLVVNLETSELIGDVDVFTATTFRPLLKFTLFGDAVRLTKSFYLRKDETLVLRVEARAVGDAEGTYRIRFEGSFAPAPEGLAGTSEPAAAPTLSASESRGRNVRRVTSTGARIEEPAVAAPPKEEAKEGEPQPAPTPTNARPNGRRSAAASARGRGARPAPSRSRAGAPAAARPGAGRPETSEATAAGNSTTETQPETPAANTSAANTSAANTPAPRRRGSRSPRRGTPRESAGAKGTEPPSQPDAGGRPEPGAAQPATAAGPTPASTQRLIIVTKDGETLERDMNRVRRVTVENNQVVIVTTDGKVIRRPMASVLKMSIEP
jgi:hypothetical protein